MNIRFLSGSIDNTTTTTTTTSGVIPNNSNNELATTGYILLGVMGLCFTLGMIFAFVRWIFNQPTHIFYEFNVNMDVADQYLEPHIELGSICEITHNDENEICSICLEIINRSNGNENMYLLNCGHKYHVNCWNQWKNVNNSCAICRYDGR